MKAICTLAAALMLAAPLSAGSLKGHVTAKGLRSSADAVVYATPAAGGAYSPPGEPVVMDQKGKDFVPRVLPVMVGTTVSFLNSDPFAHNVFTPDGCADEFDLGSWATGETRDYTFKKPCTAVVLCSVHPEMIGYVVAVETPYFAVTADDGSYTIDELPEGSYEVSVWHERLPKTSRTVEVAGASTADFTLQR